MPSIPPSLKGNAYRGIVSRAFHFVACDICGSGWGRSVVFLIRRSSHGEEPLKELHPRNCIQGASHTSVPLKILGLTAVIK